MLVLRSVASKSFDQTIVSFDRNLEPQNMVASHDVLEHVLLHTGFGSSFIYEQLNLFEESWLLHEADTLVIKWWEVDGLISIYICHFRGGGHRDCLVISLEGVTSEWRVLSGVESSQIVACEEIWSRSHHLLLKHEGASHLDDSFAVSEHFKIFKINLIKVNVCSFKK